MAGSVNEYIGSRRIVVAFSGKAGCGKTTLARMFAQKLMKGGLKVHITSFANALRRECEDTFPGIDWWEKPTPPLTRRMLQSWGQVRREIDKDYWVAEFAKNAPLTGVVIVDDLRFENEARYLKDVEGAVLFRLNLDYNPLEVEADISEVDLDNYAAWDGVFTPEYGALDALIPSLWQRVRSHPAIINMLQEDDTCTE